jgi:hypothetical protein
MIRTIDYKFAEMCDEMDMLRTRAEYWKKMYDDKNKEWMDLLYSSIAHNEKMMANVLMLCMHKNIMDAK